MCALTSRIRKHHILGPVPPGSQLGQSHQWDGCPVGPCEVGENMCCALGDYAGIKRLDTVRKKNMMGLVWFGFMLKYYCEWWKDFK